MTVRELKEVLSGYDDNEHVVIEDNTRYGPHYAYAIRRVKSEELSAYYGDDFPVISVLLGEQIGMIASE